jgi:hypothetical protein
LAFAAQRTEQKHPARVVVEQVGFDVADVFGGGPAKALSGILMPAMVVLMGVSS